MWKTFYNVHMDDDSLVISHCICRNIHGLFAWIYACKRHAFPGSRQNKQPTTRGGWIRRTRPMSRPNVDCSLGMIRSSNQPTSLVVKNWLVVGPPLWKIWKSSGMISNPICGKIKDVPNHFGPSWNQDLKNQPASIILYPCLSYHELLIATHYSDSPVGLFAYTHSLI